MRHKIVGLLVGLISIVTAACMSTEDKDGAGDVDSRSDAPFSNTSVTDLDAPEFPEGKDPADPDSPEGPVMGDVYFLSDVGAKRQAAFGLFYERGIATSLWASLRTPPDDRCFTSTTGGSGSLPRTVSVGLKLVVTGGSFYAEAYEQGVAPGTWYAWERYGYTFGVTSVRFDWPGGTTRPKGQVQALPIPPVLSAPSATSASLTQGVAITWTALGTNNVWIEIFDGPSNMIYCHPVDDGEFTVPPTLLTNFAVGDVVTMRAITVASATELQSNGLFVEGTATTEFAFASALAP